MSLKPRSIFALLLIGVAAVAAIPPRTKSLAQSSAQNNPVTITVAVPGFGRDAFSESLISAFQAAHPDIKLSIVSQDGQVPPVAAGLDSHFESLQKYAASADVLFVDSNTLSVEGTLAGYFLDLSPLAATDNSLNSSDFYPSVWQAFQWNKGLWGIPTSVNVYVMTYIPSAFDKAGLAYPSESWTIDDLMAAVDKSTVTDASGKVTQKGLTIQSNVGQAALFRSLIGEALVDASQVPNQPRMDTPAGEALLDAWYKRSAAGDLGFDPTGAPISISSANDMQFQNRNASADQKRVAVLLPGGKAGLDVQGFAVSKGTPYPDQSYAVAAFFSTRTDLRIGFAATSARQSLAGQTANNGGPGGPGASVSAEVQAVINKGIDNGLSLSDLRYVNYLNTALQSMASDGLDAKSALQAVEATAIANQNTAIAKKDSLVINVATPVPVQIQPGKITLKFGIQSNFGPGVNQDKWTQLAKTFAANDPQVGYVSIESPGPQTQGPDMASKYDCFYLANNQVQNMNINALLNLDPYLSADASFDKADILPGVLDQVTRDNKIWALPISIEPDILKYDADRFGKAGITLPATGWTVDSFMDALKQLKVEPTDDPPLVPSNNGGTHLLILIASFGGLPIDFRTSPPTFNYTDANTVSAIQQVLDLAKNGYIKYSKLGAVGFNFGAGADGAIIYTASLNAFNFRPGPPPGSASTSTTSSSAGTYKSVIYPKGRNVNGVSYRIGTAYISATTQNADACYRWISQVAQNPDLFSAMPARRSLIQSTTQGDDLKALYQQLADELSDPNTISIPSLQGAQQSMFYQLWLFQAFDSYVLSNGDLESGLKDAQDKSVALSQCVANLPAFDPSSPASGADYFRQYSACATKVDPSLSSAFN